ncbi:hypothetical protein NECAME_13545 [Necator americanus]|uniref:Uncharacterized protein n=1 Tax=Necator americanus TaxID=51031 RepID=W2SUH8_NECAM|nr:hypothetical protein NECAME_13545 [Necator americanus]ETN73399.1 hypothetical protein NECAME_13545 [Necator americanus]
MADDFTNMEVSPEEAIGAAYFDVADRMLLLGRDLIQIVRPHANQRPSLPDVPVDYSQHESEGSRLYASLNTHQRKAADDILTAMNRRDDRCFSSMGQEEQGKHISIIPSTTWPWGSGVKCCVLLGLESHPVYCRMDER